MGINYIDIAILIIVGVLCVMGYKSGFIKTVFSLLSFFVAFILMLSFAAPFTSFMETTPVSGQVKNYVYNMVMGDNKVKDQTEAKAIEKQKTIEDNVNGLNLPWFLENEITKMSKKVVDDAAIAAKQAVAESTAQVAFNILCSIILYLIIIIGLNILKAVLSLLGKLPVLKSVNKLLGAAIGALNGLLIVYILLGILAFTATTGGMAQVIGDVDQSVVGSKLYNNNIIFRFAP